MVYLVSADHSVTAVLLVELVKLVQMLVPISELLDNKLLQLYNVNYVELCFDLVQNHDTKLVSDRTVAILLQN